VEGDSAFGTVKPARITQKGGKHFQEVLPLRGKVLNAARKGGVDEVLKNSELANITQAIGTGIGPAFNLDKCRYKAIYLLMDADSDGKHIQALLLAFFAKFMPQLIEDGRLYVVESPLFMGVTAKDRVYGDSAEEVKEKLGNPKKVRIARFKGLGESDPTDLRAYAMHPKTRSVCHVQWGGKKDQELVMKYMGLDATARKELLGIIE
jgi:DNA gyrase/topoisomerase IV subunit B